MRPLSRDTSQTRGDETLQRLLAIAAQYEPENDPPSRLVADALKRASRQEPVRRPTAILGWTAAVGVLGLLAVHRVVTQPTSIQPEILAHQSATDPVKAHSPSPSRAPLAPERSHATGDRTSERRSGLIPSAPSPRLAQGPRPLRSARQTPPPTIRLKVETVHRYHAGVLAPAMIAEHDETTGHETLIPAVVDLPVEIPADVSEAGGWLQVRPASLTP